MEKEFLAHWGDSGRGNGADFRDTRTLSCHRGDKILSGHQPSLGRSFYPFPESPKFTEFPEFAAGRCWWFFGKHQALLNADGRNLI